jgi:glycosyltransferase involved in cell wall biosynthesis
MDNVTVVVTGTNGISGGIATLNLNILLAVQELTEGQNQKVTVLSYLDQPRDRPDFLENEISFKGYDENKTAFVVGLLKEGLSGGNFFFDHVTLAAPILPIQLFGHITTVIFAHGSEAWRDVRRTSSWAFQAADLCLANSHFTLRKMRDHIPPFSGEVCPLGLSPRFDLTDQLPTRRNETVKLTAVNNSTEELKDKVLLLVGRMDREEPGKGRRPLIRILPELQKYHPGVQLVFPGAGNDIDNLKASAREYDVDGSVFLPGYVSTEILEKLYQKSYAYVMPSRQEGFGLVYLEAMNYGLPCIGCWNDGAEEVITHRETGYLVEKNNDKALYDAVIRLLDNPRKAELMGKKGFKKLRSTFSSRHFRRRFRDKIRGVLQ